MTVFLISRDVLQMFRSHLHSKPCNIRTQALPPRADISRGRHLQGSCRLSGATRVITHGSSSHFPSTSSIGDGQPSKHRVYMIDPDSPEIVEEFHLEPHPELDRAEDLLAQQQHEAPGTEGWSLTRQQASDEQAAMLKRESKAAEMQKALMEQLELEQRQVVELQRYEGLYKEVMMRADRSEADVIYMQNMVAEKDAELAHTYKLLEASANERSRLRLEHQAAQERMRDLQAQLIQAQAQARTPRLQALASTAPKPPPGREGGLEASPFSVDETVEELTNLAYSLAMDMSEDVTQLYPGASPSASASASSDSAPPSSFSSSYSSPSENQSHESSSTATAKPFDWSQEDSSSFPQYSSSSNSGYAGSQPW